MKTLTKEAFLRWADGAGLCLDAHYPRSAVLTFQQASEARFWNVPAKPERRPYFIARLIELMGDWQSCYVWRHLGSWPVLNPVDPKGINDLVEARILQGIGVPLGTTVVLEFQRAEFDCLVTLLFSTSLFARSVGQDLYVVPDHALQILQTDHHDVIHVGFRTAADAQHWIYQMAGSGFVLPGELPDSTFKQPKWMPTSLRPPH